MENKPSEKQVDYLITLSEKKNTTTDHKDLILSVSMWDATYVSQLIDSLNGLRTVRPETLRANKALSSAPIEETQKIHMDQIKVEMFKQAFEKKDLATMAILYIDIKDHYKVHERLSKAIETYISKVNKRIPDSLKEE